MCFICEVMVWGKVVGISLVCIKVLSLFLKVFCVWVVSVKVILVFRFSRMFYRFVLNVFCMIFMVLVRVLVSFFGFVVCVVLWIGVMRVLIDLVRFIIVFSKLVSISRLGMLCVDERLVCVVVFMVCVVVCKFGVVRVWVWVIVIIVCCMVLVVGKVCVVC